MGALITVEKDVDEDEQLTSKQNGTLQSAVAGIVMTVETHIEIPTSCATQADIERHLVSVLSVLDGRGISFSVSLGEEGPVS